MNRHKHIFSFIFTVVSVPLVLAVQELCSDIQYSLKNYLIILLIISIAGISAWIEYGQYKSEKEIEEKEKVEKQSSNKKIPTCSKCSESVQTLIKDYFTTFFIALANISSVFTIVVIFTTLKVYVRNDYKVALMAAAGIFVGGATEWFITTYILSHFTKVLDEEKLIKISKLFGFLIFIFGIFITGSSLVKIL